MSNETLKQWREKVRWPWNKRPVFERAGGHRGEIFAVVVSSLALIVSAAATVGTWRQTDLMREQLTAAERNAGSLRISEALSAACRTIRHGPVRARKWKIYLGSDGRPAKTPIVADREFKISIAQREAFGNALEDLQFNLSAVGLYRVFVQEELERYFTEGIERVWDSLDNAIDVVDARGELDYVRLRAIANACSENLAYVFVDVFGVEAVTGEPLPLELDPLSRKLLEPNPDPDDPHASGGSVESVVSVDP